MLHPSDKQWLLLQVLFDQCYCVIALSQAWSACLYAGPAVSYAQKELIHSRACRHAPRQDYLLKAEAPAAHWAVGLSMCLQDLSNRHCHAQLIHPVLATSNGMTADCFLGSQL